MKTIIEGLPKKDIKDMVEDFYGSCMWEILATGEIVCFPTGRGSVRILPEAPQPIVQADAKIGICPECNETRFGHKFDCSVVLNRTA